MNLFRILIPVIFLIGIAACVRSSSGDRSPTAPTPPRGGQLTPGPSVVDSKVTSDCGTGDGWNYCVHRYPGQNPAILYYVHGYTDSNKGWTSGTTGEYAKNLEQLQKLLGPNSPTVVLISYSNSFLDSWMLSVSPERQTGPKNATLDHFTTVAMPEIERAFNLHGKRILFGMSMGGFNASQLCLHHPELWDRCLLQQPMLITCDPFANPTDYMCLSGYMIRSNFVATEWEANNPMVFEDIVDVNQLPPILVSGATKDQFRLYESDKAFAGKLKGRGAHVEWHEYVGAHENFDPAVVYEFITR